MMDNPYRTPIDTAVHHPSPLNGRLVLTHFVIAFLFGLPVIAAVLGINIVALIIWVAAVVFAARQHLLAGRKRFAAIAAATQVATMAAMIIFAILAPVKTTERVLQRPIILPKTTMTLGELQDVRFDFLTTVTAEPPNHSITIKFPSRQLRLGQFIAAVENQSPLRHRFSHCGNGWTVLWGGDCSFGVHLRDPN